MQLKYIDFDFCFSVFFFFFVSVISIRRNTFVVVV